MAPVTPIMPMEAVEEAVLSRLAVLALPPLEVMAATLIFKAAHKEIALVGEVPRVGGLVPTQMDILLNMAVVVVAQVEMLAKVVLVVAPYLGLAAVVGAEATLLPTEG